MAKRRGKPSLNIRMDEDLLERLKEAFPAEQGRAGGLSLAIRKLLHVILDEPVPPQYGEADRDEELDWLEARVRALSSTNLDNPDLGQLAERTRALLNDSDDDPVRLFRLRAILGRLCGFN